MNSHHAAIPGFALALVLACGPDTVPGGDDVGDSTTESDTNMSSEGDTTSDTTDSADAGDTGEAPACEAVACGVDCSEQAPPFPEAECTCQAGVVFEDYLECEAPSPCDGPLCAIQALRYGVYGSYKVDASAEFTGAAIFIDVLGDGRAQAWSTGYSGYCCDGLGVDGSYRYYEAQPLLDPSDPSWAPCIEATQLQISMGATLGELPSCIVTSFTSGCGEFLQACPTPPTPPGPNAGCDETCPMANDGVCDEASGTGLCPAGCDPLDCTCVDDQPGQCDESWSDAGTGTCPIGSDPDC